MKKFSGQFRNTVWDPTLIIFQIIALQAVFYLSLGGILFILEFSFGSPRSLDNIFKYQVILISVAEVYLLPK